MLSVLGIGAGSAALVACAPGGESAASSSSAAGTTSASAASTSAVSTLQELNSETAGPYPGDGSNGPDVLDETGIERKDLTQSVDGNGSVEGAKLTLTMNLIDISNGNAPLTNAAVYVWHCNGAGQYSMYSDGVTDQTWLRGVQVTDSNGQVTFDSIVPGCYTGRWPHIHFEVFKSIDEISDSTNNVLTSQIVVPEDVARAVYGDSNYDGSTNNLNQVSLDTDNVFSDGWEAQTPTVSGDASAGYTFTIDVPVDPTTKSQGSAAPMPGEGGQGGSGGQPPAGGPSGPGDAANATAAPSA
ncbi:3,4-dioxygenase subunit beta [uncultured Corynebacterium sp.]|uniref:dioxygenase family protein n=1 Tax=uncultured Corynebacterium sp. TaxID=159447 RepID=UPI00345AB999